jgi:thiol-disulfide isomerase/thioredoxin
VQAQTPALLYPASDGARDIDTALSAARKDGKHVLLDFGADWCPDCRVLGALFEDAVVAPFATENFHVVHVDVGRRDKNADLIGKYHATAGEWIPAVVVLDRDAKTVGITDSGVRLTRRSTPQELLALLRQWAPKKRALELAAFTERGVHVTLAIERDSRGELWLSGTFTPTDADTHLYAKDLPPQGVNGLGRPTRIDVSAASGLTARGALVADRPAHDDRIAELQTTLSVYPAGPVTLRLPVARVNPRSGGPAVVSVTYMACGSNGCLPPVIDKHVPVVVPSASAMGSRP